MQSNTKLIAVQSVCSCATKTVQCSGYYCTVRRKRLKYNGAVQSFVLYKKLCSGDYCTVRGESFKYYNYIMQCKVQSVHSCVPKKLCSAVEIIAPLEERG